MQYETNCTGATAGTLYLVATPIGNLGDISQRAIDTMSSVDVLLAEDTRVTRKLCNRFEISTRLIRFDEHTTEQKTPYVLESLAAGKSVALVSDAGTPGIADPGSRLAAAAKAAGYTVVAIPGPSAVLTALVSSGLPTDTYYFVGFTPRKQGERAKLFDSLASLDTTLIFFESPRRVVQTLSEMSEVFSGRQATLARELTKLHEEVLTLPIESLAEDVAQRATIKGEIVLLIGPPLTEALVYDEEHIRATVQVLIDEGLTKSDAIKRAAKDLGVPKNSVYELVTRGL